MVPRKLSDAFRRAFYVFARGGPARDLMIQCGVDALLEGYDGELVVVLAGLDSSASLADVVSAFREAARELGIEFPGGSCELIWAARHAEELEVAVHGLVPPRSLDKRLNEDLLVAVENIKQAAVRETSPALADLLNHLDGYFGDLINHYPSWLEDLTDYRDSLGVDRSVAEPLVRLCCAVADLIGQTSYVGLLDADVAWSGEIRRDSERLLGRSHPTGEGEG